jgi:hypothetical protein
MKNWVRIFLVLVLAGTVSAGQAASALPRSAPEAQGVSSVALLEFVNALDQQVDGMHSLMVARHAQVIAEGWWTPYDASHNHVLYSLSKSFTSTAVGFAVAEGKLSIDDEVLKFFPDDAPTNASSNLKAMRVRDLLMMSTGHQDEPPTAPDVMSPKPVLELLAGSGIGRQGLGLERWQKLVPNHVQHGLHVFDATGDRHHRVLLWHNEAILSERAVTAIGVVPAAPELETVTLVPIAIRIAAVGRLLCRGHRHPFRREQWFAVPAAALQVKLAELRDVLRAHAQAVTA